MTRKTIMMADIIEKEKKSVRAAIGTLDIRETITIEGMALKML